MAYEKMKGKVRQAVPQFIQPLAIKATAAQKRGALKALDAITELFGPKGEYWVQGNYHILEVGFEAFCLSGAFNKVDGQHEALARAAISVAIVKLYGPQLREDGALNIASTNGKDVAAERTIVVFNDWYGTVWSDVKAVLMHARKLLS